jgi:hypothetical protein
VGWAGLLVESQRRCLAGVDDRLSLSPHRNADAGDAEYYNHQDCGANALADDLRIARPQRTLERQCQLLGRFQRRGPNAPLAQMPREVFGVAVDRVHLIRARALDDLDELVEVAVV